MTPAHKHGIKYLFVYGTLMKPGANPVAARLWRHSQSAGIAWFQGRLYRVAHYPGVVPSGDPDDKVWGQLILLRRPSAILPALDAYEGVPDLYTREQAPVFNRDGKTVIAWIYLYNRPVARLPRVRSGDFRKPISAL